MIRRCFYSFHYAPDNWRASQVRNIGVIEGNRPARDNDWETITRGGDAAITRWIANQMYGRSCTSVLVGASTANRKWINHEIVESWNSGMGVVGIHIHGLLNRLSQTDRKGANPFDYIPYGNGGSMLSSVVQCYDPQGSDSRERFAWIRRYLSDAVEEALERRRRN